MRLNLILLCLSLWMTLVLTTHGPASDCCLDLSTTKVKLNKIKSYVIQSVGACPLKAIVFYTHRGKRICADPNRHWTHEAMLHVDGGVLQQKEETNDKSASGSATTVPSTTLRKLQGKRRRLRKMRQMKKGKTGV